ncbi:hypothetical protein INT48_006270 [Thamnidium elegans]|uniref:Uncharacterized protein n=1 Tax=Thamnidium elegans TaxID=101142 RepID=A0A8H7SLB8_9FUNG|nr:hypothetical protein INT48_006270 [Thamnidium elegans]
MLKTKKTVFTYLKYKPTRKEKKMHRSRERDSRKIHEEQNRLEKRKKITSRRSEECQVLEAQVSNHAFTDAIILLIDNEDIELQKTVLNNVYFQYRHTINHWTGLIMKEENIEHINCYACDVIRSISYPRTYFEVSHGGIASILDGFALIEGIIDDIITEIDKKGNARKIIDTDEWLSPILLDVNDNYEKYDPSDDNDDLDIENDI